MSGDKKVNGPWGQKGSNGSGGGNSPWSNGGGGNRGGGSGGGGGDFEDQMRRMQERFRNRRGSGGGSGGAGGSGRGWLGVPAVGILALVLWAMTGVANVDAGQQAVIFQFGKLDRTLGPGLRFHFPVPFETREIVDTENLREITIGTIKGENLMLTQDENILDINFTVKWKVKSNEVANFVLNVRGQEATVRMVSESVMREVVGKSNLEDLITDKRDDAQRLVKQQVQALLNDYKSGVLIDSVNILKSDAPPLVLQAFEEVNKAELDAESTVNEATRKANQIVPVSRGKADAIILQAEAYRAEVIADAMGEASRFEQILTEYQAAPQVTKERMYLETVERVLSRTDNLFLDQQSGAVPYLPLDGRRSGNQ